MPNVVIDPRTLPDVLLTQAGNPSATQLATEDNVAHVLDTVEVSVKFDLQNKRVLYFHKDIPDPYNTEYQRDARVWVEDMMLRFRISNLQRVGELILAIAMRDTLHPMEEWILEGDEEWDGVDRIAELAKTVPTQSHMWPIYLRKWLYQVCEAISGDESTPCSLPHVLTFSGAQGVGKTTWLQSIAPKRFVRSDLELHLNTSNAKDSMIEALSHPIVELGEIDSSFRRSDVSALKVFLSRDKDVIRAPYARTAEEGRRRTVFFGTVNHTEFLIDGTGSRRFWPVEVTDRINIHHGIDTRQLWSQVYSEFLQLIDSGVSQPWLLDAEQEVDRVQEAKAFVLDTAAVATVRNAFETAYYVDEDGKDATNYCLANGAEIMQMVGLKTDNTFVIAEVKQWLTNNLGKHRKLNGKQRCWCVPKLTPPNGMNSITPLGVESAPADAAKKYLKKQKSHGFWGDKKRPKLSSVVKGDFPKKQ